MQRCISICLPQKWKCLILSTFEWEKRALFFYIKSKGYGIKDKFLLIGDKVLTKKWIILRPTILFIFGEKLKMYNFVLKNCIKCKEMNKLGRTSLSRVNWLLLYCRLLIMTSIKWPLFSWISFFILSKSINRVHPQKLKSA